MTMEFPDSGLYAITDSNLCPGSRLLDAVELAIDGGAKVIQYRHKGADIDIALVRKLRVLCTARGIPLIINDDIALALEINADGVHLGKNDQSIERARTHLGHQALIGVSCYNSAELARKAQIGGATYVAFGRFFASKTKPHAKAADIEILDRPDLTIPIVAIGGITPVNGATLLNHGANLLAVIDAVFGHKNPKTAAAAFQHLFDA